MRPNSNVKNITVTVRYQSEHDFSNDANCLAKIRKQFRSEQEKALYPKNDRGLGGLELYQNA